MQFKAKPAQPIDNRLLIALAGPQASGKTTSALRLATGITKVTGGKICLIDTENKRALRYAKAFSFDHMEFDPPFSPMRYLEALNAATAQGYGAGDVIIIDSMSHEHEGAGGVLEMHEAYLQDKAGDNWSKREKIKFTAWIKPKADRTRVIQMGMQRNLAHIILCFRAKEKVAMIKGEQGKTEVVSDGIQPIGGDEYFFEMDITMILPQGAMGKPDWSEKASRVNEFGEDSLRRMLHGTQQISEATGEALARLSMIKPTESGKPDSQSESRQAPPSSSSTEEKNRIKSLASQIKVFIENAKDAGDLESIWAAEFQNDLEEIRAASEPAYAYLRKAYDDKMSSFESA